MGKWTADKKMKTLAHYCLGLKHRADKLMLPTPTLHISSGLYDDLLSSTSPAVEAVLRCHSEGGPILCGIPLEIYD